MAEQAVQVVTLKDNHTYALDLEALKKILERDDVRNLPVVVVSIVGAYRSGKSFLLNYLLRYLKSSESAREDGSWMDNAEALRGFSWRGGSERNTTGILLWSEPIICTNKAGEKMAIILMDTQGTFDSTSSVREISIIVGLSTLLSSIEIFNISQRIKEDDLQFLQLFTEYGKLVTEGGTQKPFQVLEFLIRDWMFPYEYSYGAEGGKTYIKNQLEVKPNQPKEIQDVHRYIQSCFEKITCFLMPHPGFEVLNPKYDGNTNSLSPEFKTCLKELATSLFGPEKLNPKQIGGTVVKAQELCTYFQTYMELFNSGQLPTPTSIMTATSEAGLQVASIGARAVYEHEMQANCQQSMASTLLHTIHRAAVETARNAFMNKKKLASKESAEAELEKLTKELNSRIADYSTMNTTKTYMLMNESSEAYDNYIAKKRDGKPFRTHPANVYVIHKEAVDNAKAVFTSKRKLSNPDKEMEDYFKTFDEKLSRLMIVNEENNRMLISEIKQRYWDEMYPKATYWPPFSSYILNNYHVRALNDAKTQFESGRIPSNDKSFDKYMDDLTESISSMYRNIESINDNQLYQQRLMEEDLERNRRERERIQREEQQRRLERQERERRERERRNQGSSCTLL